MRGASLVSLALMAGLLAGCGPETPRVAEQEEPTAAVDSGSERDLTRQASSASAVEVASPVELTRPVVGPPHEESRSHTSPEPAPAPDPATERVAQVAVESAAEHELETAAVLPAATLPEVAAEPAREEPAEHEPAAGAGRELAPGTTVTVIPAVSGPSIEADPDDSWLPSERPRSIIGGGGGTCRPRGGVRGVGIAGRFPVGLPPRRLR
jgi:hypothetical protein